ncbi:MAG: hypothetical protein ACR2KV_01315 [Solirubrobacteraceae bacterium]
MNIPTRRARHHTRAAPLAITLAAATSACLALVLGGATAPSAAAPSGYAQHADRLCAAAGAKIEHLSAGLTTRVLLTREVTILAVLVRRLKAIRPPAAQAKQYRAFVSETGAQVADIRRSLASSDPPTVVALLNRAVGAGRASNAAAASLGLAACARDYTARGT